MLNLIELCKDFDVFYSCFVIVFEGCLFGDVCIERKFGEVIDEIRVFLDCIVMIMDNFDVVLLVGLEGILEEMFVLRLFVWGFYIFGFGYFVEQVDLLCNRLVNMML